MRPEAVRARCNCNRNFPVTRSVSYHFSNFHRTPSLPCVRGGAPQGRRGCPTGMHRQAVRAGHAPGGSSCTVRRFSSLPCHPLESYHFSNFYQQPETLLRTKVEGAGGLQRGTPRERELASPLCPVLWYLSCRNKKGTPPAGTGTIDAGKHNA